ncbi:hypothetical protein QE152_g27021 [Popillia japonica]|uniref:Uncharacterized protein n=1 Tax=Popillia japonica TaxID=7064 RepID=A0AAW1JWP2_POPJA
MATIIGELVNDMQRHRAPNQAERKTKLLAQNFIIILELRFDILRLATSVQQKDNDIDAVKYQPRMKRIILQNHPLHSWRMLEEALDPIYYILCLASIAAGVVSKIALLVKTTATVLIPRRHFYVF